MAVDAHTSDRAEITRSFHEVMSGPPVRRHRCVGEVRDEFVRKCDDDLTTFGSESEVARASHLNRGQLPPLLVPSRTYEGLHCRLVEVATRQTVRATARKRGK